MLVYHKTWAAEAILEKGFEDRESVRWMGPIACGVWLSDQPLDCNEGATGDTVLVLDIPEEVLLEYDVVEDEEETEDGTWVPCADKPYREFLAPAEVVNRYGPPRVHDHDWAGSTVETIRRVADSHEQLGRKELADRLRHITIPFLERHGLLGAHEEE